jgi:hypothetical protein
VPLAALHVLLRRLSGASRNLNVKLRWVGARHGPRPDCGPGAIAVRFVWRNSGTDTFRTEDFRSSVTPFSYAKPCTIHSQSWERSNP